ncbi:vacuole morphology and inheritance protein 14 [Nannizzia gypsea CBS 118893]|uniref:Vacuole morphology and inheritance protein 14 n=1 Tax=Arthroderma gypseum (strain ATCC MYA-4604 / CBS 118893) TaxID=535722 RepID=E5QZV7_ARTGP|nr:vacuole morphology and inheritance protein 14 [Nannizzia gypsea CBS 118893]EFQ97420.1 vacuole morphology and inheritance protein 14 [Nannizzia gypsea CBS 118893]
MATIYMDPSIQRLLNDKLYDKRKQGALELEKTIRESIARGDHTKIKGIIDQLCHEYAYAVHQPHARNGGLIGLAAAAIALGSDEVAPFLKEIVPPVLACFTGQDARVRYYACESMYNIAKVAKGEILLYFNDIFDALCKLASDSELSVKNGAELLDRLIKDIVAESAASYVSALDAPRPDISDEEDGKDVDELEDIPTAFSLAKFIPLLQDRIFVQNPFARNFLVSWLTLLDTIPDLELVTYLPAFLGGLFKFLSDTNRDVHTATQGLLERFLNEIKRIARVKKGIAESRRDHESGQSKASASDSKSVDSELSISHAVSDNAIADSESATANEDHLNNPYGDWVPGQDVHVDHSKILEILVNFVDTNSEDEIQLTALRWIDSFFEISPADILQFVPRLLSQVLPTLSSGSDEVRQAANRVNNSLMQHIVSLTDEAPQNEGPKTSPPLAAVQASSKEGEGRRTPTPVTRQASIASSKQTSRPASRTEPTSALATQPSEQTLEQTSDLDYAAAVNALTLQFLNENEATRVAALAWLIMLHRKAPRKVLAFHDGTFPALLKTLSDPAEAVVTRDLQLLSQISRNSEDSYFTSFMVDLLQLFSTDRKLLEGRGNLIIRQLCMNLSPERIYRTLADCLEKEEDIEFASIMIQNLNNNLITAPELADLRKRLRNLETKDGQLFFVALFRSWCHNSVATFSLCLLAQAYEQAYNLLQIFAELEMTVNMLIQIDKLVQLLESPVFTYLRLQLLEPDKYPYLYKCLYGLLMLLPQSSAFAALKNRLNSVSNIGLLYAGVRPPTMTGSTSSGPYERSGRLKAREESAIRWADLLDKFKSVQERSRRSRRRSQRDIELDRNGISASPMATTTLPLYGSNTGGIDRTLSDIPVSALGIGGGARRQGAQGDSLGAQKGGSTAKPKTPLGTFGRLSGIGQRKSKK